MKTKLLLVLALLATLGMTSCKKDKDEPKPEPTTVKIGNNEYPIVTIGTQTWTAENYSGEGGVYYNNDEATNASLGKLYTIAEANAIQVPDGWRLPTLEDYKKLLTDQGVTLVDNAAVEYGESDENSWASIQKIMATSGWEGYQGTNTTGFNALPAGEGEEDGSFDGKGQGVVFWTSSKGANTKPYHISIITGYPPTNPYYIYYNAYNNGFRFYIRFVKIK